jgi:2-methylisocitrate lyase-like PEP mutase family enzyme
LFAPGLVDLQAIAELCNDVTLPVNVMMMPSLPGLRELADAGVARISHGPSAFLKAMECVEQAASGVLA